MGPGSGAPCSKPGFYRLSGPFKPMRARRMCSAIRYWTQH